MANGLGNVIHKGQAWRRQFPHVDADALQAFEGTCEGVDEGEALDEVINILAEMEAEASSRPGSLPSRSCGLAVKDGEEPRSRILCLDLEGGPDPPRVNTVVKFTGLADLVKQSQGTLRVAMALPCGDVYSLDWAPGLDNLSFWLTEFGLHELRVSREEDSNIMAVPLVATSHLGDFGAALDRFHDVCDWVWDGDWTEELEDASITLLAALDTHFEELSQVLSTAPMGSLFTSELGPSRKRLETALGKALEGHDAQSMGRVYSAVRSMLSFQNCLDLMGPMLGGVGAKFQRLEDSFLYEAVRAFDSARCRATTPSKRAELKTALTTLINFADGYLAELAPGEARDFVQRWTTGGLRDVLVCMRDDPNGVVHPMPFFQLRSGGGGILSDMMKSVMSSFGSSGEEASRATTIEGMVMLAATSSWTDAVLKVARWSESLVEDAVIFGSPMSTFGIDANNEAETSIAAMLNLMALGFGYVTQGEETTKLIALLDRDRATLPLESHGAFLSDKKRRDRLKDVRRVLRAARKKGGKLTLTASTDFDRSLAALREHHADNWVGPKLEEVWKRMLPMGLVCCFELWYRETSDSEPKLIAADFGHPHSRGQAYYVATRFFDREFRTLQPGFLLAFAEAEALRRRHFKLWDLGGADKSPMMQYKPQVAIEMDRCDFLRRLRECQRSPPAEVAQEPSDTTDVGSITPQTPQEPHLPITNLLSGPPPGPLKKSLLPEGVLFEDLSEEALWGAVALAAQEKEQLQAQQKVPANKKNQAKPAKNNKNDNKDQGNFKPKSREKAADPAAAIVETKKGDSNNNNNNHSSNNNNNSNKNSNTNSNSNINNSSNTSNSICNDAKGTPSIENASSEAAVAPAATDAKERAKLQFQQLVAESMAKGMSQSDAVAHALRSLATS